MAAKQCGSCGLEPVERARLRHGQKPLRRVELSCLKAQLRRGERALRSPTWVGCQSDGALQERGSGGDASARLRAAGGSFQLTRDRLVGCGGGRGQMPCPTVWINLPIGRLCQCEVHTPALIGWRGSVDRGANQRMTEPHGFLDREQPIRGVSRGDLDPEPFGCTPDEQRVADRLGGGDEQQEPRSGRNRFDSALKALLEPSRQRLPRGVQQTETTGKLLHRQPTGQLQQRERVASRLGDDAIADPLVEPNHDARTQKRARVPVPEPENLQLREPAKIPGWVRAPQREVRLAPRGAAARRRRASWPTPRPATARRRRRRGADVPLPPPKAASGPPARRGIDPAPALRSGRTRPRVRRAVAEGVAPRRRAAAHTAGARTRTRAPSPTRHPRPEGAACLLPTQRHSSGALSFRSRPRRESAACDSRRRGARRPRHRAGRTPNHARASSPAPDRIAHHVPILIRRAAASSAATPGC